MSDNHSNQPSTDHFAGHTHSGHHNDALAAPPISDDVTAVPTAQGSPVHAKADDDVEIVDDPVRNPDAMHPLTRKNSIPVGTLDPEGTAELERKLTQHSLRSLASRQHDQGKAEEENYTANPFDADGKFHLEKFLSALLERAEGGDSPGGHRTMGVVFRNLTVTGLGSGVALNSSVGSAFTAPLRLVSGIRAMLHPPVKTIIDNFEGCVKPGEMLLVLGRPGAGCTSFLKTLASYRDGFQSVQGEVLYEGLDHKAIEKNLRAEVAYLPEDDIHFPTMTVGQTLDFAAATRAPQAKRRITLGTETESREDYIKMVKEVLLTILGLRETTDVKVGNDLVRGVSGGQRKRVSVAEQMALRSKVNLWDNASRGLDSSTALEFVQALRVSTDITQSTTVASIYQAGEGLVRLFDKILLIYDGKQVYFGPMDKAYDYFYEMGYQPFLRQTTADFLVSVTDPHGRAVREGYENRVPRTADEMVAYWRSSELGKANSRQVEEVHAEMKETKGSDDWAHRYKSDARTEQARHVRKGSRFILSWPMQTRLCIKRRAQIVVGDIATQAILIFASIFQALITGSVFYQMPKDTSGFFSRGGVIFFALLYNSFTAMSEITVGYAQRPIVIRQNRFAMVHPSADALANTLLDMPIRIATLIVFDIILYFMTGLAYTAGQFFTFFGFTVLLTLTMVAFFRCLASSTREESTATMIGGLAVIDLALYAGYVIPRPSMVIWWKWLSYCNPVSFGFEALLTNEFRNLNVPCANYIPSGPGYENANINNQVCPIAGAEPGNPIVNGATYVQASFGYSWSNAGRNAGIIIAFWIFFIFVYLFTTEIQKDPAAKGGVMVFKRGAAPKEVVNAAEQTGDLEKSGSGGDSVDPGAAQATDKEHEQAADALPVATDVFSWQGVTYDVMVKGNSRRLLSNVNGFVAPGRMTALMGESGAGKTTLLNVLAQRTNVGVVGGDMLVNGRSLPKSFQAQVGYCQQQDVHMAAQTVREALLFSALLRQPAEVPKEEKMAYVDSVITMLEMEGWADAMVGEVGQGLSVEQRKRLTIGVELAAKPDLLLFLDEPTSGLDSQSAWSIVRFLRKLADHGQAILCTIHQPSGQLFNQFDRLMLLQKGGKQVYFGDLHYGKTKDSRKLIDYFEERSGQKCTEDDNPAEFILDVIGAGATATTKYDWHKLFLESDLARDMQQELEKINNSSQKQISQEDEKRGAREYAAPFGVQLWLVTKRAFQSYWRSPVYIGSKLALNIIAGLFIGSSFWAQGKNDTIQSLQNLLFAIFMSLVISTSLAQQLQPVFINLRSLYEARERPSKLYSWPVALVSSIIVEIPWNILGGTLFWACWYWMTGFPSDSTKAGYHWGLYMLFELYFVSFAQAIAAMSPNPLVASILFSTFFSFVIIFCGVVQPPPQLPYFWRSWMFHLSPFTYLIEGFLGNAIGGKPIICSSMELSTLTPPAGQSCEQYLGAFSSPLGAANPTGTGYFLDGPNGTCQFCQYRVGDDYLTSVTLKASERYRDIGIICAYIAFNYFLCFATFYLFRIHAWGKTKSGSVAKAGAKKGEEAVAATSAQASGVPPNEKITEQLPVSSLIDPPGGNVPVQDPKSVQERSA